MPTLVDVKGKLNLDPADTTQDAALQLVLDAVIQEVADRTRFAASAGPFTQVLHDVQLGQVLTLRHRPITAITAAEAQQFGSTAWSPLTGAIVDADLGLVSLLGSQAIPIWPPVSPPSPWFGWQAPYWPLARFTYTASVATIPDDLFDAVAALAAYRRERQLAGIATHSSMPGGYDERYLDVATPPWVEIVLMKYDPDLALAVF